MIELIHVHRIKERCSTRAFDSNSVSSSDQTMDLIRIALWVPSLCSRCQERHAQAKVGGCVRIILTACVRTGTGKMPIRTLRCRCASVQVPGKVLEIAGCVGIVSRTLLKYGSLRTKQPVKITSITNQRQRQNSCIHAQRTANEFPQEALYKGCANRRNSSRLIIARFASVVTAAASSLSLKERAVRKPSRCETGVN